MPDVPSERRFRVALSFPSEKRAFVKNVANRLAERLDKSKVLFDEWYEAEFARIDLGTYLPELYRKDADLVVVFHCSDYVAKTWCGAEWRAIHSLIHQKNPESVMLCRFDFCDVPGIYETAGYVDIKEETESRAAQVAELVLQRLDALNPPAIKIPTGDFVYVCECAGDLEGVHYRFVNDLRGELEPLNVQVIAPEFRKSPEAK
ncbi:MAG: TIR domain-containing protein, partial [Planctomycetota bacterium]|nr:TIR domain-containing protein [Planctomycetota bacterium]